ncbi:MAG: hydrogenase [Acidobacteria bacterium]|nr:MAG: hydrogenase [Acidobacteriota bacterium]REK04139.1 MAG: hydrogenase [Acidobacteriota bacterium]REK15301.1 MAG: hydrogenase [Acidobacteriota bacterium]REK46391.1 MAG: hydrogenase [Acidobacteriota bacterium]
MQDVNDIVRKIDPPMVEGDHDYGTVTDKISDITLKKRTPFGWFIGFAIAFLTAQLLLLTTLYLVTTGVGVFANNQPVAWAFPIINFVWWIGIGHAGTLISAILLLLNQKWRTSINRFAEAMTLFAVACAGLFPILHTGRPWLAYWLLPYPNTMGMWPQFRSPLMWDVFAVSTYATVSLLFWYVGLIPDIATLRDRAKNKFFRYIYGLLSWGWRGSARHWHRYEIAYLLLAGLSTPLVLSVHSIVSLDFSVAQLPGWHATIFPPYFVAGAIFAGFAMVLILTIPLRVWYNMKDLITDRHLIYMGKVMLATGLIVCYGYAMEAFFAWYSAAEYEVYMMYNRMFEGPYWWSYWLLILCNGISIQFLWFKRFRESPFWLFVISVVVSVGMWLERFVIIVTSLQRDFLPSSWGMYAPTIFDWTMYIGTIGFFFALIFLFVRFLPVISIFEVRTLLPQAKVEHHGDDDHGHSHGGGGVVQS